MASRAFGVSSMSSVSSVERRAVDSEILLHTPAASVSTNDTEQPMNEQRAEADRVNETVIAVTACSAWGPQIRLSEPVARLETAHLIDPTPSASAALAMM